VPYEEVFLKATCILPRPKDVVLVLIENQDYEHQTIKLDDNKPEEVRLTDTYNVMMAYIAEKQPEKVFILLSSHESKSHLKIKIEGIAQLVCGLNRVDCKLSSSRKVNNYLVKHPTFFQDRYGVSSVTPQYVVPALVLPFLT